MSEDHYLTPLAIELIERARSMAPKLSERARGAEDAGLIHIETIREMQDAGFFKILQPQRWGGYEMDPRVFYSVQIDGSKTAEDVNAQLAVSEAMMATDQLELVLMRNYQRIVNCARTGERMPVEERLMQRAQSSQVPKICADAVNEIMRACAAGGVFKTNPIERIFRDLHVARGHIANNTDAYARAHGSVMLGLPNMDPFV